MSGSDQESNISMRGQKRKPEAENESSGPENQKRPNLNGVGEASRSNSTSITPSQDDNTSGIELPITDEFVSGKSSNTDQKGTNIKTQADEKNLNKIDYGSQNNNTFQSTKIIGEQRPLNTDNQLLYQRSSSNLSNTGVSNAPAIGRPVYNAANSTGRMVSPEFSSIQSDSSRADMLRTTLSQNSISSRLYQNYPTSVGSSVINPLPSNVLNKTEQDSMDPNKLNDALAVAGVNIQREEELLMQQSLNRNPRYMGYQQGQVYNTRPVLPATFLYPYHLASFMQRTARENGVIQSFYQDTEMLELMSAACESWLSNIVSKTLILSSHRRKAIPSFNKSKKVPQIAQRSEFTKELRNMAVKQREMEEKRVSKRIALGLENFGEDASNDPNSKAGAEETLHRAANATAAMMTMNTGKKKYSWMSSSANEAAAENTNQATDKSRQSHILAARSDSGLRYREIRTGNTVTIKDLLGALEDERMGVESAIVKGYIKMRD